MSDSWIVDDTLELKDVMRSPHYILSSLTYSSHKDKYKAAVVTAVVSRNNITEIMTYSMLRAIGFTPKTLAYNFNSGNTVVYLSATKSELNFELIEKLRGHIGDMSSALTLQFLALTDIKFIIPSEELFVDYVPSTPLPTSHCIGTLGKTRKVRTTKCIQAIKEATCSEDIREALDKFTEGFDLATFRNSFTSTIVDVAHYSQVSPRFNVFRYIDEKTKELKEAYKNELTELIRKANVKFPVFTERQLKTKVYPNDGVYPLLQASSLRLNREIDGKVMIDFHPTKTAISHYSGTGRVEVKKLYRDLTGKGFYEPNKTFIPKVEAKLASVNKAIVWHSDKQQSTE